MDASSNRVCATCDMPALPGLQYCFDCNAIPNRGATVVTVQRACNGCGRDLRDATKAECEAAISGAPLPDVRSECPDCSGHATRNRVACGFEVCNREAVGAFWVYPTIRERRALPVCQEHGDAISQSPSWNTIDAWQMVQGA